MPNETGEGGACPGTTPEHGRADYEKRRGPGSNASIVINCRAAAVWHGRQSGVNYDAPDGRFERAVLAAGAVGDLCQSVTPVYRIVWVVAAVLALAGAALGALRAQSKPASAPWSQPRTAWGDPDLDGVWTSDNNFAIPLERPPELADKEFLDGAELDAELAKRARTDRGSRRRRGRRRGPLALVREPDRTIAPQLAHRRSAGTDAFPH